MNVIQSLLASIHTGQSRIAKVARTIAGGTVPTSTDTGAGQSDRVDLSRQAVELLEAEHQVAVSARAVSRIDDTQDALLDVLERD